MTRLIGRVRHLLPKGRFVRSVTLLTGGTAFGQAVALLAMPVLAWLYSPGDFGILAVFTALVSILTVVSSLRFEMAIPLPNDEETAVDLLVISLLTLMAFSLLVALGVWAFGGLLVDGLNSPGLAPYLWLMPLGIFGAGAFQVFSFWAIRNRAFKSFATGKLHQNVAQAVFQIAGGVMSLGPFGLLFGDLLGRSWGSLRLARPLLGTNTSPLLARGFAGLKETALRYRRFPLYSSPSSILNAATTQLPTLFIATEYGAGVAGAFALAQRLIKSPAQAIINAVSQVFLGEASRIAREDIRSLSAYYLKVVKVSFAASLLPCLLLAAVAPALITGIFGTEWADAGAFARVLAIVLIAEITISSTSQITSLTQAQHLQLLGDVVRLVLTLLALGYTWHYGLSAVTGYSLLGGITIVTYGLYYLLYRYALRSEASRRPPAASPMELESHS